ncbi:MAG: succinylglutamate desuccinylase/aspartoacylase family protein [Planctomycetota bacterium]
MRGPLEIGGRSIAPGERKRVEVPVARLFTQTMLSLPVTVVHGAREGPRLWLDAAIHGDELNGAEIIRRVLERVQPAALAGALIAVPVVNVVGFIHQSRYLPDRRDLNRSFPGSARGSLAARLAHLFLTEIVQRCTHGLDLHTGSLHRANLPQVRANLDDPETARCAKAFGAPITLHARAIKGSLREAAARLKLPILVYEAGEPLRFDEEAIRAGVAGILRVMKALGMTRGPSRRRAPKTLLVRRTAWVRTHGSGIFHLKARLGRRVKAKQDLGVVLDAYGDAGFRLQAPCRGIVIGHTNNPLVHRGDAVVHVAMLSRKRLRQPDPVENF